MNYDLLYLRLLRKGLREEDAAMQVLAWASLEGRPKPPELIPGLLGINKQRLLEYQEKLVAYKLGAAERLMYGLIETIGEKQ